MKDKANKGYWQRLAKIYAPLMESDKKFYNAICGYIRDYLKSDMNVLELACGTGQLSFPLSDCTNSWTATDFSENMIKQAKRRIADEPRIMHIRNNISAHINTNFLENYKYLETVDLEEDIDLIIRMKLILNELNNFLLKVCINQLKK